ncbi:LANO_0B02520g1_1 [Lachancea nothofagi CBS 11611]|uniref:LANO_0B02520g1_1 n=1 Tax=Lachancea nothofagi CBS 11611 TaxID=1266666 RepID=A0A1G4IW39_9SACH|nr:LANO_0B02520g1_1 [Lachancea nothofagi CBS 11611]
MSIVAILGSGVIGLSTAYELLLSQDLCPKELHIIAQHFPGEHPTSHEYTSAWAGAHFRPFPHRPETYESDARESRYTRVTYKWMKDIAARFPESTVRLMQGIDFLEDPPQEYDGDSPGFNSTSLDGFQKLPQAALPRGVRAGFKYNTYCLNAPEYLGFLQDQVKQLCESRGVRLFLRRMTLRSLSQVHDICIGFSVLFNCSGKGLQFDGSYDPMCYAIRGQTLLLNAPQNTKYASLTVTTQDKNGNWTFVIKRPTKDGQNEQYILGGTKQANDNSVIPRDADSRAILKRGRILYPELMKGNEFSVALVNVGFRPARKGGSRVELERSIHGPVIHSYGFGGMGFETSLGVAAHSLRLYREFIGRAKL